MIIDPSAGRTPAREYVLVQGEFYGQGSDYAAMLNNPPDVVAFNGQAFRYRTQPLTTAAGELVRLSIVNAGPNLTSAFHVIGALFDHHEASGSLRGGGSWRPHPWGGRREGGHSDRGHGCRGGLCSSPSVRSPAA